MAVNIDWDARRKEIQARAYSENFNGWSGKSAYSKEGVENSSSVLNDKARQLRYSQNTQKTTNNQKISYTRYLPRTGEELTAGLYNHILANAATDDRYRQKYASKNYNEIQSILSNLPDGEEKNWLSKYIESDFFDRASSSDIIDIQNKYYSDIENLQKQLDDIRVQNGAYSRGGYAGANINLGEQISALEQDSALEQKIKNAKDRAEALNPYIVLAQRRENVAEWDKYRADDNFLRTAHDGATIKNPTIAELDQYAYDIDNATNGRYDEATAQRIINNPVEVKNKLAFFLEHKDDGIDYLNSRPGTYEDIIHKGFMYNWDKLKPEEINMYNYLLATQGEEASEKYLDDIQVLVDKRVYDDQAERTAKAYSEVNGLGKLALNIATVPANVIGGAAAFADDVSNIIKYRSINPYSPGHSFQQFSSEVRGLTAQDIEKSIDNDTIAKFASNGYQAVMSGLDSALGSHLLDTKYTITMGMGATSQRAKELYEAGASNGQIMLGSIASGIIEGLFEKVSLDKFAKNFLESDIVGLKDFLLKALVQGGIEASEEINTEISNMIIDAIVMGANSDNEKLIREFMAAGDSEIVARQKAALNAAIEVFWAGYGGFISGGTMAAVRGTPSYLINNSIRNEQNMSLYGDSIQDLINESLELDPNNKLAKKIKSKLDAGKEVKAGEVTRIVNQNNKAITELDISSIQEATANRLTELGETGDVAAIASALTKQVAGQKLSDAEQQAINNSRYGKRVANELNPENINSGGYSSAWAEKIDTSRINVDEYSRLVQDAEIAQENTTQEATPENTTASKATQATANTVVNTAPDEVTETTQSSKPTVAVNETVNNVETPVSPAKDNNVPTSEEKTTAPVTLESASKAYGAQAGAFIHTYQQGQDVQKYNAAYRIAYDQGVSGVSLDYVKNYDGVKYLTDTQKELAYKAGKDASDMGAIARDAEISKNANGKTGWKKGVVKGKNITGKDLQKAFNLNSSQVRAYNILTTVAEATGIDIVLYKSEVDADGNYIGAYGKYKKSEPGTIYIDINAGLENIKSASDAMMYVMVRTFNHEFVHFIENWNPVQYNEFRRVVFDTIDQRRGDEGYSADQLIVLKMDKNPGLSYEAASREVVADAMTDILPDSNFIQELADNHKTIFDKLLEKLKEFAARVKEYFNSIGDNPYNEAKALKEQIDDTVHYLDNIVKMFDEIAVKAVENYQSNVAVDEVIEENTTTAEATKNTESEVQPIETVAQEPKTTTSENGYTITDNLEYGSIEIKFNEKPSDAVRDVLKANKFRWHKTKGVWYGKATHEAIMDALDKVYEADRVPVETTPAEIVAPKSDFANAWEKATREEKDEVLRAIDENTKISHMAPTEIRVEAPAQVEVIKEENANGENEDNEGSVLQSEPNGEGTSRLLDELQTEDVQGTGEQRETVEPSPERGGQDKRDSDRQSAGAGNSRSEGTGESGDLRRLGRADGGRSGGNDGAGQTEQGTVGDTQRVNEPAERDTGRAQGPRRVSQEDKQVKKEKLKETVSEQIEQKSKETPKGSNYVIGDSINLPSGEKARFKANIDAIRLIKQLETEGRYATATEQEILSKYVGWGGLSNAFGELRYNRETRKSEMVAKLGWENEFAEFRKLVTDGIITEEEYKAMSASTKNAHYTSIEVIKAMYDGLKQLGFTGGRMLEPSSGVGNFVGAMPADMSSSVNSWTMVELDRITGQIAKYLYPNADVRIQGFETANIPDNYMDVAIGNVPFGNYGVVDRNYPKRVTKSIHNYFFAKTLDKVRPGGVVMFITSSFTMNSQDNAIRKYIADRADLLGAIRLPNTAFSGNAGTEVVTDILVLKKRADGTEYAGEAFLEAPARSIENSWQQVNINEYFDNHPEMVLGTAALERGMYGSNSLTYNPLEGKGNLGDQIREAFKNITGKMDYKAQVTPEKSNFAAERAGKKTKQGGLEVKEDGKVYRNENGNLVEVSSDKAVVDRVSGLLGIRDAYRTLINDLQQGVNEKEIKQARKALNKAYDDFVNKYGLINSPKNKKAIADDPDSYSLLSLENYDPKKKTATKADIFTKDTITANKTITHVDDTATGVIVSINRTGGIDTALIAEITGKSEESVTRELIDSRMAFKTKDGRLEAPETYLSGNVRAKLREAEALAPIDKDFQNNVDELRRVIPKDIPFNDIFVAVGTPWIPNSVYADFIAETLGGYNNENSYRGTDVTVGRTSTGDFKIIINNSRLKTRYQNTQKWGTKRKSFIDIMTALMTNGSLTINDYIDNGTGGKKPVLNKVETAAVQAKAEEISKEFQEWLWRDENRKTELTKLYNETFNALVTPKYNGKNLTVNGLNAEFTLREHQANAVQRIISSGGNTLLAHKVGAGKTLEMAAAAMKLKELGVVKKPVFVVPKSLVAQWGEEFKNYFPAARLFVSDEKSFTPANRKINANRIANGDYDAIIISYEQFEKIPMTDAYKQQFYQQQIDEIIDAIAEEKAENNGKGITVKEMEKKRAQLEKKIAALNTKAKDEDNIRFEELGIDSLFVDEAHNFKNLEYVTRMKNISGLGNTDGSQRAFDLYTKVRYLQQLNGGRGIVFATATPVMNSMAELYIMQKYLQSDMLEQLGLKTFDAWAKQFGEVVNSVEIKPSGQGFRVKQTFSNFRNLNELQLLFRSFSDVLTQVPGLEIPKMKGGKVNVVVCEPGQFQKDYMAELEKRADNVKNVDPSVDNMLKITSDGRKVAYTQRMIDPTLPYEPGCKLYRCCDNVLTEYKESSKIKGTQIVFCDMATPKGKSNTTNTEETDDTDLDTSSARLYDDMKAYLVKKGIPANEIAFIHDADTDAKKTQLFADVNDGKVRVLIGSTGKMGVGMNAQKRIVAIHHLDAPWRPGDVEQRDGRAFRQKNINTEVTKYTYVTEGSFDARLWDILDRKQHFIEQIMNGDDIGRSAEDTGNVTLSAAEVKALASGNPMIMEQVQLSNDLAKLNDLKKAYNSSIAVAKSKLLQDEQQIGTLTKNIENCKEDIKTRVDTYSDGKFSMKIGKNTFTEKKDAGTALASAIVAKANQDAFVTVGEFAGFELRAIKQGAEYIGHITGKQAYKFNIYLENTTYMVNHIIGVIENLENRIQNWTNALEETKVDLAAQQKLIAEPFAKQAELEQKLSRYNEVMSILNPKEEQTIADDVQYQQRTKTLTDREILSIAASEINIEGLTDGEISALDIFKGRLTNLYELEQKRAEEGRQYRELQFGKNADRTEAQKTLNRMKILDEQIERASSKVLDVENKAVLQSVLRKARKVIEKEQWTKDQETLKRWRDRRNNAADIKKYRERIRVDVADLTGWILKPDNKNVVKHIPDALKSSVIPFLTSIDFTSKQQLKGGDATKADKAFMEQLTRLKKVMNGIAGFDINSTYSGYVDLPPDFMQTLGSFADSVQTLVNNNNGEFVINRMTSDELQKLSKVVRNLKAFIKQINRFHNNAMFRHVYEAGDNSIDFMSALSPAKNTGTVSEFLFWQQMRPAYAFERFGDGGIAIYDELRRGQAKLAFNTKEILAFSDKAYTAKEVSEWEKDIRTIDLGDGDVVKMSVSQIMSLYELSKRERALGHILGEGIRVATFKNGKAKYSDNGHLLTPEKMNTIFNELSPRQKEVADKLQQFMQKKGGEWGNYVSMARFGENQFGEENYFPINSDGRHLQVDADEKPGVASLYALLNMGFTKQVQEEAKNRIVIYSIFDVFSNHMASVAQYNAMALPVVDALKWFNYQQVDIDEKGKKTVLDSVREQMDRAYGVPEEKRPGRGKNGYAQNFVINIIKAFNGTEAQGSPMDTLGLKMLHKYNRAQVAYNFRVVVQQPLAITRAADVIDYASIIRGLKLSKTAIEANIAEMQKYSGIAAWKSLGFYDVNISRGLTQLIKHDESSMDKFIDFGMKGAEFADTVTWAAMWSACKEEVSRKQKLTPKSEGFYEAVTKLFEDVIYKTQVVDSVLTKNEFMRDKGLFARAVGSFMSEPTTTASMLLDKVDKMNIDRQRGLTFQQVWKKHGKQFARTVYVYAVGAAILAAAQAVIDAFRDDDDYEEFIEKWLEAFKGNAIDELMPLNKLPILSDVYEFAKSLLGKLGVDTYGNPPNTVYMQWQDSLVKAVEIFHDKVSGDTKSRYTWYGGAYKLLQALSGMVGVPMAGVTREVVTAWNSVISHMAPSLKVKTYDAGTKNNIKYAYQDGYLTEEEAISKLLISGEAEDENDAYWIVKGFDGESKYNALESAIDDNDQSAFKSAMDELTTHGVEEKTAISKAKSIIREMYNGTDDEPATISGREAVNLFVRYTGMSRDDIKNFYEAGDISNTEAVTYLQKYADKTANEANTTVTVWEFKLNYPNIDWDESQIAKYNSDAEPYGISVKDFDQYLIGRTSCKGTDLDGDGKTDSGSVKSEVLLVIDSLPISNEQKDALYRMNGWSERTINEAPWR